MVGFPRLFNLNFTLFISVRLFLNSFLLHSIRDLLHTSSFSFKYSVFRVDPPLIHAFLMISKDSSFSSHISSNHNCFLSFRSVYSNTSTIREWSEPIVSLFMHWDFGNFEHQFRFPRTLSNLSIIRSIPLLLFDHVCSCSLKPISSTCRSAMSSLKPSILLCSLRLPLSSPNDGLYR